MKILVGCEYSGRVREAFKAKGHHAVSCDLKPSLLPGEHYQGNIFDIIDDDWDMMIVFPPCTYLCTTGNKHFLNNPERWEKRLEAAKFAYRLFNAKIEKIAMENPVGVLSTYIGKPSQIIQPYDFGDPFSKQTCLWLKGIPPLLPTSIVDKGIFKTTPSGKRISEWYSNNKKSRDLTFPGIADAMANQWG